MNFDTFKWYIRNLSYLELALKDADKEKLQKIQEELFNLVKIGEKNFTK